MRKDEDVMVSNSYLRILQFSVVITVTLNTVMLEVTQHNNITSDDILHRYTGSMLDWVSGVVVEQNADNAELVKFWNTFQYVLSDLAEGLLDSIRKFNSSILC